MVLGPRVVLQRHWGVIAGQPDMQAIRLILNPYGHVMNRDHASRPPQLSNTLSRSPLLRPQGQPQATASFCLPGALFCALKGNHRQPHPFAFLPKVYVCTLVARLRTRYSTGQPPGNSFGPGSTSIFTWNRSRSARPLRRCNSTPHSGTVMLSTGQPARPPPGSPRPTPYLISGGPYRAPGGLCRGAGGRTSRAHHCACLRAP